MKSAFLFAPHRQLRPQGQSGRGEAATPYLFFRESNLLGIPTFLRSNVEFWCMRNGGPWLNAEGDFHGRSFRPTTGVSSLLIAVETAGGGSGG